MAKLRTRGDQVRSAIAQRQPFQCHGSLRGGWHVANFTQLGRLPAKHRATMLVDPDARLYVVHSYATPIAWWSEATGWQMPDERYSPTTSQHQSTVRHAIG
jgi:hypothetical protein